MTALEGELDAYGGAAAPASATARLRDVLNAALRHGRAEMAKPRSGYDAPVEIGIAQHDGLLVAATPAPASLRVEPGEGREWLLAAATVGALIELAEPGPPTPPRGLEPRAGEVPGGLLPLAYPGGPDPGLLAAAFDEHPAGLHRPPAEGR